MDAPDTLTTPRLLLRVPVRDDAAAILASYAADPEVTRFLSFRPVTGVDEVREFLVGLLQRRAAGAVAPFVIEARSDGRLLGAIDLRLDGHRAELGYVLARAHWGHGYMVEAVRALADWALAQPAIHRVWAVCDVDNPRSARVLEKAGLLREGCLRRWNLHPNVSDVPRDCWCYARVREAAPPTVAAPLPPAGPAPTPAPPGGPPRRSGSGGC